MFDDFLPFWMKLIIYPRPRSGKIVNLTTFCFSNSKLCCMMAERQYVLK